jgi:TRAP-type C4-dicarboxylate transport system permease small subunit
VKGAAMKAIVRMLKGIDSALVAVLKWLTIGLTLAITLIIVADVFLRYVPLTTLTWKEEVIELCFAGLVFFGAAAVWMAKGHFSVGDFLTKRIKGERAQSGYQLLLELAVLTFAVLFFKYSLDLVRRAHEVTSVLNIPKKYIYLCMPISSAIMILYSLVFVARAAIGVASPKTLAALEPEEEQVD